MPIKRANNNERAVPAPNVVGRVTPCAPRNRSKRKGMVILLLAFCLVFSLAIAADQKQPNSTIKGFKAPLQYFESPHELQVKTFLAGTEAEPGTNGSISIQNAELQTFHEDGSWQMTAKAPHCFWDSRKQTVSSPGPMQVVTANENYLIHHEGVGFIWMQTNSDLFISNNVCTTITPLTNSPTP